MRRANRRLGRVRLSGDGDSMDPDLLELTTDDEDEEEDASPISYAIIPAGVYDSIIPARSVSVVRALSLCPPALSTDHPTIFSNVEPSFSAHEPNFLAGSPDSLSFVGELIGVAHDLLWASQYSLDLRDGLADALDAKSLQLSPMHYLPLWVIPFLVQLNSANIVLRR